MRGGARARSGPPPDPNALRRGRSGETWTELPASGREGPTPPWPLINPTPAELVLWERQWSRPQAIEWERHGQDEEVALYVRTFVAAASVDGTVSQRNLVRQMHESLGLSVPGLMRNRWRIVEAGR